MRVRIFGKKNCAKCETTKNKLNHFLTKKGHAESTELEFHDMDTVDGMAEGAFNDVLHVPTTIIEKEDRILARWEGEVPGTDEFKTHFK